MIKILLLGLPEGKITLVLPLDSGQAVQVAASLITGISPRSCMLYSTELVQLR